MIILILTLRNFQGCVPLDLMSLHLLLWLLVSMLHWVILLSLWVILHSFSLNKIRQKMDKCVVYILFSSAVLERILHFKDLCWSWKILRICAFMSLLIKIQYPVTYKFLINIYNTQEQFSLLHYHPREEKLNHILPKAVDSKTMPVIGKIGR